MHLNMSAKWRPICPGLNELIDDICERLTQLPVLSFTPGYMMTSSNGNISRVAGLVCWEFNGHPWMPCAKASDAGIDVFFDLRVNKRLRKQSWGWWFERPSRPLWRHSIVIVTRLDRFVSVWRNLYTGCKKIRHSIFFINRFVTWIQAHHISNPIKFDWEIIPMYPQTFSQRCSRCL